MSDSNLDQHQDDTRPLAVPDFLLENERALELLRAWYADNKVHVMTRGGTRLDDEPAQWGAILASVAENVVARQRHLKGAQAIAALNSIKLAFDEKWAQITASAAT